VQNSIFLTKFLTTNKFMNHEFQVFNFQLSFAKIEKGRDIKADKKKEQKLKT